MFGLFYMVLLAALPGALLAFLASRLVGTGASAGRRRAGSVLITIAGGLSSGAGTLVWLLRDGLGPGIVGTHGIAAVRNWWDGFRPMGLLVGLLVVAGIVVVGRASSRPQGLS